MRYVGRSTRVEPPLGLPLIKPPWGRITAIDMNTGNHVWMVPNGQPPDYIKNNPLLAGIDLSGFGNPERAPLLVTKTLLFAGDGPGLFSSGPQGGRSSALSTRRRERLCLKWNCRGMRPGCR